MYKQNLKKLLPVLMKMENDVMTRAILHVAVQLTPDFVPENGP
jgi:hypothetical protein